MAIQLVLQQLHGLLIQLHALEPVDDVVCAIAIVGSVSVVCGFESTTLNLLASTLILLFVIFLQHIHDTIDAVH